jgi:IclR family pca regulon transcriptional regulator
MLAVLEMVAQEGPVSAAQVARLCDINRTVAHRLLATLAQRSFVRRTDEGYTLGPMVVKLGRQAEIGLKEVAKPFMNKLAQMSGETVVLHVIDKTEAVVLDQALGLKHLVRVEHTPGSRHPLCQGASGWSILAFQNEKTIQRVIKAHKCGADPELRIQQVREVGYAVSHDELQMGVHGIAAPLFNADHSCGASIGLLVPSIRSKTLLSYKDDLLAIAKDVSGKLAAD